MSSALQSCRTDFACREETLKSDERHLHLASQAKSLRVCTVGFQSPTGILHSVEVEAETLYEAAGLGLARLKKDGVD